MSVSASGKKLLKLYRTRSTNVWNKKGEAYALKCFHRAVNEVPAYSAFLKSHKIESDKIVSIADFAQVPETDKSSYIKEYPLGDRVVGGLSAQSILAVSSGTSGQPTLWPRGGFQEADAAAVHFAIMSELYEIDKLKTLIIVCFPMGVYVSGMATSIPLLKIAEENDNITVITAGNNKEIVLQTIPKVIADFEQIVLVGHPFFVKDVLESGKRAGIRWGRGVKVRTFFCSEGFNEVWRDYLASLIENADPQKDFYNMYGSSELLLMGFETTHTIALRRAGGVLGVNPPNIFQYDPTRCFIEVNSKGELLFTAWSGVPLIRYNLHDAGSVLGVHSEGSWKLPLVTLNGRSDHTLIFYAANIYPEHIHTALNKKDFLSKITGKFVMEKNYTASMDQKLIIHVELQDQVKVPATFAKQIKKRVIDTLLKVNMEYSYIYKNQDKDVEPKIVLHSYRNDKYFKVGLKPQYIKK